MAVAGQFALFGVVGWAYLLLAGAAVAPWALPRRWALIWPAALPLLGWAALIALAYPLNASFPGRPVLIALGLAAAASVLWQALARRVRLVRPRLESLIPVAVGLAAYAAGTQLYAHAGTTTALVADSDVEHFADVIAALLAFPIGWEPEAQMGLEATPIGLAYHYVHASLSALTGADTFVTAVPAGLLMLALAPSSVFLFVRDGLRLRREESALATVLFALGGLPLAVASFGWGQQTAALAAAPAALAALQRGLQDRGTRSLLAAGLLAALAACALYLASAPVIGGAAALMALWTAVRQRSATPVGRLAAIGAVVALAGALSHVSAAAFLLGRTEAGLLRADELSGRSTHVTSFASFPAALGVAPLDLFGDAAATNDRPLVAWVPPGGRVGEALTTTAGGALVAIGLWAMRRRAGVLGPVLLAAGAFELYLRALRPFPYGEFKLLSTVWFVVAALAAAGAGWLARRPSGVVWPTALAAAGTVLLAGGLLSAHAHTRTLLAAPWGAVLPETEMAHARRIAAAVPRGASVWVSNQLVPQAAIDWAGTPSTHRAGFATLEAGQGYLAARWKGVITSLLAFEGKPAAGTVQRHSTELRAAAEPAAASYVLLDASEDPLLLGLADSDAVVAEGRLRLYRSAGRRVVPWPAGTATGQVRLTVPPAASVPTLQRSPLPIGESLPGRRTGVTVPATAPTRDSAPTQLGGVACALFAAREQEVEVRLGGMAIRRLAVLPGVTWYVTPPLAAGQEVAIASDGGVLVLAAVSLPADQAREGLTRSRAGLDAPFIGVAPGGAELQLAYVNYTRDQLSRAARVRRGQMLWLGGRAGSDEISLDPGASVLRIDTSQGETRVSQAGWLQIGAPALPALHEPPLVSTEPEDWLPSFYSLPLYGRPAPPPQVENGTLVKGSSSRLHLVEQGKLRWVPSLEALQRRGLSPRVVTLPDADLWRLPQALPLD